MATREEKIQLIEGLKQQGLGRSEIKSQLLALDEPQAAKELPGLAPQEFKPAGQPTAFQATFPRATATGERTGEALPFGRKVAGGIADILSLPGRGVAGAVGTAQQPPERKEFKKAVAKTRATQGGLGGGIESIIRSPSTGAALAASPFTGGGSLGFAGRAAIESLAGAGGTQVERFAEKGDVSPGQFVGEAALGAAIPAAGKAAIPAVKGGRTLLGRTLQETTGVSEDALRKFGLGVGKGAEELKVAAGTQFKIAEDLVNKLDNIDEALPNRAEITTILEQSPPISTANVIETLEKAKTASPLGAAKGANAKIDEFIADIRGAGTQTKPTKIFHGTDQQFDRFDLDRTVSGDIWFTDSKKALQSGEVGASTKGIIMERFIDIPEGKLAGWDEYDKFSLAELRNQGFKGVKLPDEGRIDYILFNPDDALTKAEAATRPSTIPATEFRALRQQIDREIGDQFGKESSAFISALKNARNTAKNDLLENTPPEFADAMSEFTEKLGVAERLKSELGKTATTRENRAEAFVSSLFGANKTVRRQKLQEFQDLFGGDFLEQSKTARLAAELGEEGIPGLLPRQFTGRAGIGPGFGAALGGIPGAAIGAASASPRLAAGLLGGLDIAGGQVSRLGPKAAPAGRVLGRALQRVSAEQFRSK